MPVVSHVYSILSSREIKCECKIFNYKGWNREWIEKILKASRRLYLNRYISPFQQDMIGFHCSDPDMRYAESLLFTGVPTQRHFRLEDIWICDPRQCEGFLRKQEFFPCLGHHFPTTNYSKLFSEYKSNEIFSRRKFHYRLL